MSAQAQDWADAELVAPPAGIRLKLREIRLHVDKSQVLLGFVGLRVEEAGSDALEECRAVDRRFIFGGKTVDDRDEPINMIGVLGDASLNPRFHKTPDAYIQDPLNSEANRKSVFFCWRRLRAIEVELQRRAQTQAAKQAQNRDSSRAQLTEFLASVPNLVEQFEERAEAVAAAEARVRPIADALVVLVSNYPTQGHNLPMAFEAFARAVADAASALGRAAPELPPLPPLPNFDGVKRMAAALRGEVGRPAPLRTGTERITERTLQEARGG